MKIDINKFNFESDKILSSLSKDDKEKFLSYTETLYFKRGNLIFFEKGFPTGVFLVKTGSAKIFKTGVDGKDQIFYIYRKGDLLGYHALLCNEKYEDSCEALEDCAFQFVSRHDFERLLVSIPALSRLFIQNMSHEFGVLVNSITILAQKSLRERFALHLLILNDRFSEDGKGSEIRLPREDLANIIGTARESLGRLLKDFKQEELIKLSGKNIVIKDAQKLLKIASSQYR